jgi:hypothetical protein
MTLDSGDIIALRLLDTSRRFKGERKGKIVPHSLRHRPGALQRRFIDLDDYLEIFIVLELTLVNPDGSIAPAS